MQGLADGYFVLPYTIGNYLAPLLNKPIPGTDHPEFEAAEAAARARFERYLAIEGTRSPDHFHRELGQDHVGLLRHGAQTARAREGAVGDPGAHEEFRTTCASPGAAHMSTRRWRRPAGSTTSSSSPC